MWVPVMQNLEDWSATEASLLREAGSVKQLLAPLKGRISPVLIADREWERIWERVRGLPVTLAAFPFGFELPLHDPAPRADFGFSLVGGSRSEQFFLTQPDSADVDSADVDPADVDPAAAGIGWLLDEMRCENSPLRRVAGRKALLEYDIAPAGSGPHPEPGIFLYPAEGVLKGDQSEARFRDLAVLVDGVVSAAGWASDAAEREQVERLYRATDPNLGVRAVGAFPSRARGLRVAVTGFRKTAELTAFLERAGWSGRYERLAATVSRLEERGAYGYLGLHFDVRRDGLGSKLGLSFFHQQGEWLRDFRPWEILVEELRRESLAVPEKLSALSKSCCGAEALFGKSGMFVLLRGIHHLKLVITEDTIEEAKAYIFWLMRYAPSRRGAPAK